MSTELAKLRRIVERADLATAIIEMDGAFAKRLSAEMFVYGVCAGSSPA